MERDAKRGDAKQGKKRIKTLSEIAIIDVFRRSDSQTQSDIFRKLARVHLGLSTLSLRYFPSYAHLLLHACGAMDYPTWQHVKSKWLEIRSKLVCGWSCPGVYGVKSKIHLLTHAGMVKTTWNSYEQQWYQKHISQWIIHDYTPRSSSPIDQVVTEEEFFRRLPSAHVTVDGVLLKDLLIEKPIDK